VQQETQPFVERSGANKGSASFELLTIESWFSLLWVVESALDTHEWWGVAAHDLPPYT